MMLQPTCIPTILFLHPNNPDYVGDGLFHGLRLLLGNHCIDYPRMDYMYKDYPEEKWKGVGNEGKVLYGHLEDNEYLIKERRHCFDDLPRYSLFIISNPIGFGVKLRDIYLKLNLNKNKHKIAWIDGSDTIRFFPFATYRFLIKHPFLLFSRVKYGWYFKRENAGISWAAAPMFTFMISRYKVFPINISIPPHHIAGLNDIAGLNGAERSNLFPAYLVDKEIAAHTGKSFGALGKHQFVFRNETDYWADIDNSRFGPTTKRGGWDALRHYEYAARGTVLCFRNLDEKPAGCAPHGLNSENAIIYKDYQDLMQKISALTEQEYQQLQHKTLIWAKNNTTTAVAQRLLDTVFRK